MMIDVAIVLGVVALLAAIRIAGFMLFGWLVSWLDVDWGIDIIGRHR